MNYSSRGRVIRPLISREALLWILAISFVILFSSASRPQVDVSLKSQATEWLMQDAPPNPPLRAWMDGIKMMIKEKSNLDVPVEITSEVLDSGLVQVQAKVGTNILLWQVDYPKRKYYSMNKFTIDFMALIARSDPIRK